MSKSKSKSKITVLVPAFNEQRFIGATLESLKSLDPAPYEIIVAADSCTDRTAEIARSFGVTVIEGKGGSKAAAQNFALPYVTSPLVLPVDADCQLAPNYLELLEPVFDDPRVTIGAGRVLTQRQDTVWAAGRQFEYLHSFGFFRRTQQMYASPTVAAGCCSVFRVHTLRQHGGFPEGSLCEDIHYSLMQHCEGNLVRYVHNAVAYADEPDSARMMRTQLKRWSSGHAQSVRKYLPRLFKTRPMVALWLSLQIWEKIIVPPLLLLSMIISPIHLGLPLLGVLAASELVSMWGPVLLSCHENRYPLHKAIRCYLAFWALKPLNLEADFRYWVKEFLGIGKPFATYERGHE